VPLAGGFCEFVDGLENLGLGVVCGVLGCVGALGLTGAENFGRLVSGGFEGEEKLGFEGAGAENFGLDGAGVLGFDGAENFGFGGGVLGLEGARREGAENFGLLPDELELLPGFRLPLF
jgi:hypothetical protein